MKMIKNLFNSFKTAISKFFKAIYQNKKSATGFTILLAFILVALFGRLLPAFADTPNSLNKFAPPSLTHLFGTDHMGRDLLVQLIFGARDVIAIAFLTGFFTVFIGVVIGLISGFTGGVTDKFLQMIINLFLTVPSFPVLLVLSTMIVIKNVFAFSLILSIWNWAGLARSVRAQVISIKERDFVQICTVIGMKKRRIIFNEILPNIASYIVVNFIIIMRGAITGSVGIMMLGLAPLDSTNWGTMLFVVMQQSLLINPKAIFYILAPVLCIVLFQFAIVMLANGVDEILNPRLRRN